MFGNVLPRSGVSAACSEAVSAQKYVSSTSSCSSVQSARIETSETASVSRNGNVYLTDQIPRTGSAQDSPIQPARITSASPRPHHMAKRRGACRPTQIDAAMAAAITPKAAMCGGENCLNAYGLAHQAAAVDQQRLTRHELARV